MWLNHWVRVILKGDYKCRLKAQCEVYVIHTKDFELFFTL